MNTLKRFSMVTVGLAVALAAALTACSNEPETAQAPSFTLQSLDGETVSLSDFRGKPVMVTFWTTHCGACEFQMPFVQAFYDQRAGDGVGLLTIDVGENSAVVQDYATRHGITFPVLLDQSGRVAQAYGIPGIPVTFFIGPEGTGEGYKVGPFQNAQEIQAAVSSVFPSYADTAQSHTTAPRISAVSVSNLSESSTTIAWKTSVEATSQVAYGTTDACNSTTPLNEELTTSHTITLNGLEPGTTYHFRVKSKDDSGNEAVSATDEIFTTLSATSAPLQVGSPAPDFTLETTDGENVTLSDFHGRVVMVNFWVMDCEACVEEMPYIQAVFDRRSGSEPVILAVNAGDPRSAVEDLVSNKGFTFPVLLDPDGEICSSYGRGAPTTFFINSDGIIGEIKDGVFQGPDEIESILASL